VYLIPSSRRLALTPQVDGRSDVAQRQPRFGLIRPGHAVKRAEQVTRGLSQEALAVREELLSYRTSPVSLYGLPGADGLRLASPRSAGPATSMIMKSARRWKRNATSRNLI
jgi:hypothetical protein